MKFYFLILICFLTVRSPQPKVWFDLPHLKGKTVTQIKKVLGSPKYDNVPSDLQVRAGVTGDAFFVREDYNLDVTYDPTDKRVIDFFISKTNSVKDYKELEIAGNVVHSKIFTLLPVRENRNPSLFTGITVTPL